ncbi:MAG TPA: SAM-dependent methyltransferase [Nitrospira sp.]|nr:SAM-dependent methyltransferase [Nitrospira sp.]
MLQDADALPQLIGDWKTVDQWQAHINQLFYRFRGDEIRKFYQTFSSADYRLAHALAADYFEQVSKREKASKEQRSTGDGALTVVEIGPGNGNLAACFLSHLKILDRDGRIYPRVRYLLVDWEQAVLDAAVKHPGLASHQDRIRAVCSTVDQLAHLPDGSVDRMFCNELWNDLPTKLMSRKGSDIEEEYLRPNLSEGLHAKIEDWAGFIRAFETKDAEQLKQFPPFFDDLVWEREYRPVEWKDVPYRKTITDFLRRIDDQVVVPVNIGAFLTIREAKRVLAPDAVGFSSFDAGTADHKVLNDPDKPCSGQFGGQQSFMVNFALAEAVAKQVGSVAVSMESQREFIGRSLNTNVLTLMDLLATHPTAGRKMESWEQDRLILSTIAALNKTYESPYAGRIEFPIRTDMPAHERESLLGLVRDLKPSGLPDTVAYLTEEELMRAAGDLEEVGYDAQAFQIALTAPPGPIDYFHLSIRPL